MKKPTLKELLIAITPIITLLLGYFGYTPVQELTSPSTDVEISVNVPDQPRPHQKDWNPAIKEAIDKAIRAHINEDH